jgi:hypothetical protein
LDEGGERFLQLRDQVGHEVEASAGKLVARRPQYSGRSVASHK